MRWRLLLLLGTEKTQHLIDRILLLLPRGGLSFLSCQSSEDGRSSTQWVVPSGYQTLQFHLRHLLYIGHHFWILESPRDRCRHYQFSLVVGQRGAHVAAD